MPARRLLGELLMDAGLLTAVQLEHALTVQRQTGRRLGRILVEEGKLREERLVETLSRQLHVPVAPEARLRQIRPPRSVLELIPAEIAHTKRLLPVFYSAQDATLSLVLADPLDLAPLSALKEQHQLNRLRVLLATEPLLDELITLYYGPRPTLAGRSPHAGGFGAGRELPIVSMLETPEIEVSQPLREAVRKDGTPLEPPTRWSGDAGHEAAAAATGVSPTAQAPLAARGAGSASSPKVPVNPLASGEVALFPPVVPVTHSATHSPAPSRYPAVEPTASPASAPPPKPTPATPAAAAVMAPPSMVIPPGSVPPLAVPVAAPASSVAPPASIPAAAAAAFHAPRPPVLLFEPDDRCAQALGAWLGLEHYSVIRLKEPGSVEAALARSPNALLALRQGVESPELGGMLTRVPAERIRRIPSAREMLEEGGSSGKFLEFYLKTIDFFFSLIEDDKEAPSQRQLRQVSQMARLVGMRLGVPTRQTDALAIAAYFYGMGDFLAHRGIFGGGVTGDANVRLTAELVASFVPPLPVAAILHAMGEDDARPDLQLAAAILKAVSTYIESRDGSRRFARAGQEKALRFLREHKGTRFDARVVDALLELTHKEHLLGQLESNAQADRDVLLVDKDRITLEMLELRFVKEGYQVRIARTGEEALKLIALQPPQLVLAEVMLPKVDGFELCARLKNDVATRDIPFFFLSTRSEASHVTKGLELGAEDFLTKPVNLDILISKVKRLERAQEAQRSKAPGGIRGNLAELALFDLLQVLQLGQKSTRVKLEHAGQRCELILENGNLVNATLTHPTQGQQVGREAFFALCVWEEGSFVVAPDRPGSGGSPASGAERNIHDNNDFLLMEGMRRADELKAGLAQDRPQDRAQDRKEDGA